MHIVIISILMAVVAAAAPAYSHTKQSISSEVSVEIISDKGVVFRSIPHQDTRNAGTRIIKSFLEAQKGENYGIVIRNNTPERIGIVIAVDGRNIISGRQSELGNSETMYILNAYEHAQYDGWRTSNAEVHRFYFTNPSDSYSVKTFHDATAMGVVAVAVFREKSLHQHHHEQERSMKKGPSPAAPSTESAGRSMGKALADDRVGTGFGDAQYSPVINVAFEPERMPIQKTLIKYEWRDTLCRNGILRCGNETGNRLWDADGFAPYPPGYGANQ